MKVYEMGLILLLTAMASLANDPVDSDYGQADISEVAEHAELNFMRGDWTIHISMMQEGKWQELPDPAHLKAYFHQDGATFQTEFTTDGFFPTDIRAFNRQTGRWQVRFINARRQRWNQTEYLLEDGHRVTLVPGGYSGSEDFDVKGIDTIESKTEFIRMIYRSSARGATDWRPIYRMRYQLDASGNSQEM